MSAALPMLRGCNPRHRWRHEREDAFNLAVDGVAHTLAWTVGLFLFGVLLLCLADPMGAP